MAKILLIVLSIFLVAYVSGQKKKSSCGRNEQIGSCGRRCDGTCSNPILTKCRGKPCDFFGCQCIRGFVRNEATNECIRPSSCPKQQNPIPPRQTKKCRPGEIWGACGRYCEGTCRRPHLPIKCSKVRCGHWGCLCDLSKGLVRNTRTQACVPIGSCPR